MIPDLGYLLPWRPTRLETHSLLALATFCLPVGLAAYWFFQYFNKGPLVELLPAGAYSRWRDSAAPADYTSLKQWILAACGVLAGAVTHFVWDAFTHHGARGVRMVPALEDSVVDIGGHRVGGAHLLQDANSLIGLVVVIGVLGYGLRPGRDASTEPRPLPRAERRLWIAAHMVTALVLSSAFFLMRPTSTRQALPVSSTAIALLRGLALAFLCVSVCLHVRLRAVPARLAPQRSSRRDNSLGVDDHTTYFSGGFGGSGAGAARSAADSAGRGGAPGEDAVAGPEPPSVEAGLAEGVDGANAGAAADP